MAEAVRFLELGAHELGPLQSRIAALERGITYPLGGERFSIDHGPRYPAFFERLGEVRHHVALRGELVLGIGAAVLRELSSGQGSSRRAAWYLCDLKLAPAERGKGLTRALLSRVLRAAGPRCPRGYAITMDPPLGQNPVVRLARRIVPFPVSCPAALAIFGVSARDMLEIRAIVQRHRGPLSYLSLAGVKDIVLTRENRSLELLHVQHGPHGEAGVSEPRAGALHLLCTPEGDPLSAELRGAGIAPMGTASVLAHDLADADFRQILTSDI